MNAKKFSDAMSELDTKYVDEALNYKTKMKKPIWIKWGIMAACLCLIICVVTIPRLLNGSNPPISGDLAPMVYVNNKLYQYTDSQLDFTDKESQFTYLGEIESKVSSSQEPKENFQANDDIVGAKVYQYENNIVVLIDGKYFLYSHMEDAENETVEFEGQLFNKSDLSEETLEWLLMLYHNTFLKLYSYISEYMLSWGWGVSLLSNAAISTVKPLSATENAPLLN